MRNPERRRPLLSEGDAVGVVAPGFAVRKRALAGGMEALGASGSRYRLTKKTECR